MQGIERRREVFMGAADELDAVQRRPAEMPEQQQKR
jgi:hypothetical protein